MNKFLPAALVWALVTGAAGEAGRVEVTIKGDRVNLRARPTEESEVVGQASAGERLAARPAEGEWVEVAPPDRIDVWVHRDFVREGVVQTKTLQVRAGPGINYHRVGMLTQGDAVNVRGQFGEWLKIAPPASVTLWVHRDYVRFPSPRPPQTVAAAPPAPAPPPPASSPPPPPPPPPTAPPPRPTVAENPPLPSPKVEPPPDLRLAPMPNQGRAVSREGLVKPVGYLFGRPSRFQLVVERGNRLETLCYLRGNDEQLSGFVNRRLRIEGREYWVQGLREPMLVIERIQWTAP